MSTTGEMVTLMSVDSERLYLGIVLSQWVWVAPTIAFGAMIFLVLEIGVSGVAGFVVMVLAMSFQGFSARFIGKYRRMAVAHTQERVKLVRNNLLIE